MSKEMTIDDLAVLIKGEFDRVDDRLGSIDTKIDQVETRLGHVETQLDALEIKVDELDRKVTRIDNRTQNQVDANYADITETKERVTRMEKHLGLEPLSSAHA